MYDQSLLYRYSFRPGRAKQQFEAGCLIAPLSNRSLNRSVQRQRNKYLITANQESI